MYYNFPIRKKTRYGQYVFTEEEVRKYIERAKKDVAFNKILEAYPVKTDPFQCYFQFLTLSDVDASMILADVCERTRTNKHIKDEGEIQPLWRYFARRPWANSKVTVLGAKKSGPKHITEMLFASNDEIPSYKDM